MSKIEKCKYFIIQCIAEEDDGDDGEEEETYGITTVLNLNHHKVLSVYSA